MKKTITGLLLLGVTVGLVATAAPAQSVYAECDGTTAAGQITCGTDAVGGSEDSSSLPDTIGNIINVMLFIVGLVAVVMIIYGGISYVISMGSPDKIKRSRDIIIYSVVGLVVAIIAYALVSWVVTSLNGSSGSGSSGSDSSSGTTCASGQTYNFTTNKCE